MNLVGDAWIPVAFYDGRNELVSLNDAFARGGEIRDLAATPTQRIALTRLLVCVAQAALDGPVDEADWDSCLPRIAPTALAYLERHRGAFELYAQGDEGAFLQVPNLEPTNNAVVDKLDFGLAAGNNATLFDHEARPEGRSFSDAWLALGLLTFQTFTPGGTIGVTRWNGIWTATNGKKPKGPGTSEHAPCLDGGPLHTILRSENLTATVHANLLTQKTISRLPGLDWGQPVWEAMPSKHDDPQAKLVSRSYLGRLVSIARSMRLSSGSAKMTMCNGITYPKFPEAREPGATVTTKKDGTPVYLRINLEKHPWRELASVLAYSPSYIEGRALALSHLRHSDEGTVDIWTGGLVADKGKVLDTAEWSFPLPLSMLGEMELQKYQQGVNLANSATRSLWAAVSAYCDDLKQSDKKTKQKKADGAKGLYWSHLDNRYGVLVDLAADPRAGPEDLWYGEVRRAMKLAFERSCQRSTPRQIRAFAKGEALLRLKRPSD